jgi:tyrosyl-tRNA synthetase
MLSPQEQLKILRRGAADIINEEELLARLAEDRPLRIKYGADPSAPDLHLGHAVPMRLLRDFQNLGHQIVFIIGDFTAMLGDPSGASVTRPQLTQEQVEENSRTYAEQVSHILDISKCEMRRNSEWLGTLKAEDIIRLAAKTTVARMLERDDFCLRYKAEKPISVHEFLYPIFQAYDSVMVKADVEIGGTDQRFNFLLAREFQREMNQSPQIIMVRPLIPGTDGTKKMSKSLGNYVALNDPPEEKFGKIMSLPDNLLGLYLLLLTDTPEPEIASLEKDMAAGKLNPRDVKIRLAQDIITWLHGQAAATDALDRWNKVFASPELQLTEEILADITQTLPKEREGEKLWLSSLLVELSLAKTKSEARRLVEGGGVYVGEEKATDPQQEITLAEGLFIRVGKRRMARVGF